MHKIVKNSKKELRELSIEELTQRLSNNSLTKSKLLLSVVLAGCLIAGMSFFAVSKMSIPSLETVDGFSLSTSPIASVSGKKNVISIPSGVVKANPFVPYRNIGDGNDIIKKPALIQDVPKFDLIEPPDTLGENADAVKIMDTVVSGILFDKFSPSAILNINGNDYLVKKGDTVNNYKILAIAQDSVTVKYGNNTYKAGIGGILTDGKINYNEVSNINKKFGGEQR